MNLKQAIESDQVHSAYRAMGTRRVMVELDAQRRRALMHCWNKRRWIIPEQVSDNRYLNGVLRDMDGSWVVAGGELTALGSVAHCLPAAYQHLLTANSDDWQTLKEKKAG